MPRIALAQTGVHQNPQPKSRLHPSESALLKEDAGPSMQSAHHGGGDDDFDQSNEKVARGSSAIVVEQVNEVSGANDTNSGEQSADGLLLDTPTTGDADDDQRKDKATRSDKAPVAVEDWDRFVIDERFSWVKERNWKPALSAFRKFALVWWRRMQYRKCMNWVRSQDEPLTPPIRDAICDCLDRICHASFWEWDKGSRPSFWNWDEDYQVPIREGLGLWLREKMRPSWTVPQRLPDDKDDIPKVVEKLLDSRRKGYISVGLVKSLISFFDVPKGLADIRLVYDGTKSGLNDALWAPWFPLPTVNSMLRSVESGTYMADNDISEMFLCFILHESIQELCGVDLTKYFPDGIPENSKVLWERWSRCAMGLKTSPYQAVQGLLWALEKIFGDRKEPKNVFRWSKVVLNLPGSPTYDPSRPWVYKIRKDGSIAADVHCYCDDLRVLAATLLECWEASQRVSSVLATLGLQDAARKRRAPCQDAGAWAGSVVQTHNSRVIVKAPQEKWEKMRRIVRESKSELLEYRQGRRSGLDFKQWEKNRGFMIHMVQTYPAMNPYLKGIHLSLCSHLPNRDSEGWKLPRVNKKPKFGPPRPDEAEILEDDPFRDFEVMGAFDTSDNEPDPKQRSWWALNPHPELMEPVPRLDEDLRALEDLTTATMAPSRPVRMSKSAKAIYSFADASGSGFGSLLRLDDGRVIYRTGQWYPYLQKQMHSNYSELFNLVLALEHAHSEGLLVDREVFLYTDNTVAESVHYKGTSSSKLLFDLVLRMRKLEMIGECKIHLIHVAGTRMIWSGADGLSRGDCNAGVMAGEDMLSFIPIHQSALDRSSSLNKWLRSWCNESERYHYKVLTPSDWPLKHPEGGTYI